MKTNSKKTFVGVIPAIAFYFLFMFCLCFRMPSQQQFMCFISGIFLYPLILLYPVGLIVIIFIVLKVINRKIQYRLPAMTIYIYPMALFVALEMFRISGEPLSIAIVAIVSCVIGWVVMVFWGAFKLL